MPKATTDLEKRLYDALRRIARDYMSSEELRRVAFRRYALDGDEAIEMAYDNVLGEAKAAIKGVRRAPDA